MVNENSYLLTREKIESRERHTLAPYACYSGESLGRIHPEDEHPFRTCFQRDRDRIVHCEAFRRLNAKTQVFTTGLGDHYRTRLTHTMEVAQISRTLSRILSVNEDLCEAVALAHDMGHPPFGHAGERILNSRLQEYGGFEHNAQALRLVDHLERRYPFFPGLNLTAETRRGILKERKAYDPEVKNLPDHRSVEAQIVDIADEISYTGHDLDDGIEAGLLNLHEVLEVPLWKDAYQRVVDQCPDLDVKRKRYQTIIGVINEQVTDVVEESKHRLHPSEFRPHDQCITFSPAMKAKIIEAREFLFHQLYRHPRVLRANSRCELILNRLFEHYCKNPKQMSVSYLVRIEQDGLERTVADFISGMTDRYAEEDYRQLFVY